MNRKSVFALTLVVLLGVAGPALAQGQGNGNGNGQNNGNGQDNGNGQNNGGGGNGNENGQNNGNGQGNGSTNINGNSNENGNGQSGHALESQVEKTTGAKAGSDATAPAAASGGELSESDALAAVRSGAAVSLSTLLPDVRRRTGGEVINAQLQQVGAYLVYAITVLAPGGAVSTEFYLARSGQHVNK